MVKFNDFDTEKYVLAACLSGPEGWRNFPVDWLKEDISKTTYKELQKFLKPPYSAYPSFDDVVNKVDDLDVKLFIKELSTLKVDTSTLNIKLYDLFEMYAARKVYDVANSIPNDLEKVKVEELVRSKISELSALVNPFEKGLRKRGFIYESAKLRWVKYRNTEKGFVTNPPIPFGIDEMDKNTNGGLRKPQILCFYAATNSFKTKTMANLGYNFAFLAGADVMVLTLETPIEEYETIIDSRHSLLSYNGIVAGTLGDNRNVYRESLISIQKQKPKFYIVDIPDSATSADIIAELELYYIKYGKYPDVIIIDYVNEMEPMSKWDNTSNKFKNLGVELRRITRSYNVGLVTAMQENREGQKLKDREKSDLIHVSESQYFANVCYYFIHIYRDRDGIDEALNQLHWSFKKNRAGKKHVSFTTFANGDINYVGDKKLSFSLNRIAFPADNSETSNG